MNLTIKNIPDEVYQTLKKEAVRQGRSLNAEVIQALSLTTAEVDRRKQMRASRPALERFVKSLPRMTDSTPLIREERDKR